MSQVIPPVGVAEPFQREKDEILQALAAEVAGGRVQWPGYPDAALQLQRLLNDAHVDADQIVQAVSFEPALSMQVLRIANAAIFNPAAQPARDLRAAVQRIWQQPGACGGAGFRGATAAQCRRAQCAARALQRIVAACVVVGAIARALAAQRPVVATDVALLAGLLHVVGRLHVLLRLNRTPWLLEQPGFAESVMEHALAR